jgi:hypothetical protein
MNRGLIAASIALAALAVPQLAGAAGPYDGTWQVDAAPQGGIGAATEGQSGCVGLRLQFDIKDNQVVGSMRRAPYGEGNVENATGRGSRPVSGNVAPDGTFNAQWERYEATGKLSGDKVEMHWKGECGPRTAMGGRVNTTEGAGSTNR